MTPIQEYPSVFAESSKLLLRNILLSSQTALSYLFMSTHLWSKMALSCIFGSVQMCPQTALVILFIYVLCGGHIRLKAGCSASVRMCLQTALSCIFRRDHLLPHTAQSCIFNSYHLWPQTALIVQFRSDHLLPQTVQTCTSELFQAVRARQWFSMRTLCGPSFNFIHAYETSVRGLLFLCIFGC